MLELAILGLLKEHPMHGYDLRKRLRGEFGLLASLSFGSLYPALAKLEAAAAVREVPDAVVESFVAAAAAHNGGGTAPRTGQSPSVIPLTGSLSGELAAFRARLAQRSSGLSTGLTTGLTTASESRQSRRTSTRSRKVYEITHKGEELFETLLAAEPGPGEDGRMFAVRWAFARHLPPTARLQLLERRKRQLESRLGDMQRRQPSSSRPLDRFEHSIVEHSKAQVQFDVDWIDHLISTEQAELRLLSTETSTEAS